MKFKLAENSVSLFLSENDTYNWAHTPGKAWPCSELSGRSLYVYFDSNGLADLTINNKYIDCDATELNSIVFDFLLHKIPSTHCCYNVCIGQFIDTNGV